MLAPVATSPGLTHAERSPAGGGPGQGRRTPAGRKVLYATTHPSWSSAVQSGMFWNVPPFGLPVGDRDVAPDGHGDEQARAQRGVPVEGRPQQALDHLGALRVADEHEAPARVGVREVPAERGHHVGERDLEAMLVLGVGAEVRAERHLLVEGREEAARLAEARDLGSRRLERSAPCPRSRCGCPGPSSCRRSDRRRSSRPSAARPARTERRRATRPAGARWRRGRRGRHRAGRSGRQSHDSGRS